MSRHHNDDAPDTSDATRSSKREKINHSSDAEDDAETDYDFDEDDRADENSTWENLRRLVEHLESISGASTVAPKAVPLHAYLVHRDLHCLNILVQEDQELSRDQGVDQGEGQNEEPITQQPVTVKALLNWDFVLTSPDLLWYDYPPKVKRQFLCMGSPWEPDPTTWHFPLSCLFDPRADGEGELGMSMVREALSKERNRKKANSFPWTS
ncbi:hypothetical protein PG993_007741 [Apiospora rasikravindrae]|uniref:Aminoglycoside phosphotransferase domain-containing protein n=1 Tax=Apiospora rasikravindrae TaxID=990691 RepID=A0ABR1SYC6_9PEZI